jgi:hypothetical protein
MYFTTENCEKTKVLPVIAVLITNDMTNKDLSVTEITKIMYPNSLGREGMEEVTKTDSPSNKGWVTVTTKKGRQGILPGRYDPATRKTVSWNVTASNFDVETEIDALVVKETGYYDMFNVVDLPEVALLVMHHMQTSEFANVGAGIQKHQAKRLPMDLMACVGKQKLKTSIDEWSKTRFSKWCCGRICQRA